MKDHEIPKPPVAPIFTKQTRLIDRIKANKEYRQAEALYYTDVIQRSRASEKVLNDLQIQMSALSNGGVDQQAVASVTLQEQVLGDIAQMLIKLRAWATRAQEDMRKGPGTDAAFPNVVLA